MELQLWLLFLLTPVVRTTGSVPTSEPPFPVNATLLFDTGAPDYGLRNCSCSAPIPDCDEDLANSLCSCHSVLRSSLPPAGLREPGGLAVWLKESWVLEELLNRSMVGHLRLSFCGINPLDSKYVALLGLQTLRVHSAAPGAPYPSQEITINPSSSLHSPGSSSSFSSIIHMTFLDVAVLNGLSALKAYSVVGSPVPALSQHFPHLALPIPQASATHRDPADPSEPSAEPPQSCILTFVY
ncbi:exosomal polycystin-1-interacting protein-like [Genypterus blacodes]|uniref:exosomal polycystin-1-interacting protein-like n=1 Tax=Genypterus blacodes TaxID=154954 RepID=UPI003F773237